MEFFSSYSHVCSLECHFLNLMLQNKVLNWQNFQDGWQRFRTNFPSVDFKIKNIAITIYKYAVLFHSWNYKKWMLFLWISSMCKLWWIIHKLYIKYKGLTQFVWFMNTIIPIITLELPFQWMLHLWQTAAKATRGLGCILQPNLRPRFWS